MLKRLKAAIGQYFAEDRILALEVCLRAFMDHEIDYMILNKLGDPLKQHNVKWALTVLEKAHSATIQSPLVTRTTMPHKAGVKAVRDHLMTHYGRINSAPAPAPGAKGTEWRW